MTKLALNHHATFGLATNTKDVTAARRTVCVVCHWASLSASRLDGHSRLIRQIKTSLVSVVHILHMLLENMQWGIGLSKKLLAATHPVLMTLLLSFEVQC